MRISTATGSIQDQKVDTVVLNLFEDATPGGATAAVDEATGGALVRILDLGDFKGKFNSTTVIYPGDSIPADRIVVAGLGKEDEFTVHRALQAAATGMSRAKELGAKNVATVAFGAGSGGLQPAEASEATVLGALLGLYEFDRYKSRDEDDDKKELDSLRIVEFDRSRVRQIRAGAKDAEIIGDSVNLARDLANSPGSDVTPTELAEHAQAMCRENGIKCTVHGPAGIRRLKMGALWGVAKGSAEEPRFVVMDYEPKGASRGTVAVCGKGVTFDSGGISIKPGAGMDEMKMDMSGAAATIGILKAVSAFESAGPSGWHHRRRGEHARRVGAEARRRADRKVRQDDRGFEYGCRRKAHPRGRPGICSDVQTRCDDRSGHAHRSRDSRAGTRGERSYVHKPRTRATPHGSGRIHGREGLGTSAVERVRRGDQGKDRGHQQHRWTRGGVHSRRFVPQELRRRYSLGPPGYRGYGLDRKEQTALPRRRHRRGSASRDKTAEGVDQGADKGLAADRALSGRRRIRERDLVAAGRKHRNILTV